MNAGFQWSSIKILITPRSLPEGEIKKRRKTPDIPVKKYAPTRRKQIVKSGYYTVGTTHLESFLLEHVHLVQHNRRRRVVRRVKPIINVPRFAQ